MEPSDQDGNVWQEISGPLFAEELAASTLRRGNLDEPVPLVLLHGFTQTRRSWDPFIACVQSIGGLDRRIIRVDSPGHGRSTDVTADLPTTAELVMETCGRAVYFGYSMGGRVALHIALQFPRETAALVTIGATAGIVDEEERRRRRLADEELADTVERIGTRNFVDRWLAQPMFAGLTPDRNDLEERYANSPTGLATSLRRSGTGTQESLWPDLSALDMPVLLMAGQDDQKFSDITTRMAAEIGSNARSYFVPDSGHSAHLENPTDVARVVVDFLRSV